MNKMHIYLYLLKDNLDTPFTIDILYLWKRTLIAYHKSKSCHYLQNMKKKLFQCYKNKVN